MRPGAVGGTGEGVSLSTPAVCPCSFNSVNPEGTPQLFLDSKSGQHFISSPLSISLLSLVLSHSLISVLRRQTDVIALDSSGTKVIAAAIWMEGSDYDQQVLMKL